MRHLKQITLLPLMMLCVCNLLAQSKRAGINEVKVVLNASPGSLNSVTANDANAAVVLQQLFQPLCDIDDNGHLIPVLAVSKPMVGKPSYGEYNGGITFTFEIRPEAKWDNGTPVLASDVAFTMKCIKNPLVDAENNRLYLQFINDIVVDQNNPRRFVMMCKGRYMSAMVDASSFMVMPEYVYDPDKLMSKFTIKELNDTTQADKLKSNSKLKKFAETFNSDKFQRDAAFTSGSGAYSLTTWQPNHLVLKRKNNWWANTLDKNGNEYFNAFPDSIIYQTISDPSAALLALSNEEIDVMDNFKTKDFVVLMNDLETAKNYQLNTAASISYTYIGMNSSKPQLKDKNVRKALTYAVDRQLILSQYGLIGELVNGPFHPSKPYYNFQLQPYPFDLEKAKTLLDQAGWKDSDNDGIRDTTIDGKKVDLKLTFSYASGTTIGESVGLYLKENCAKIGIDIELSGLEWSMYINRMQHHELDMYYGAWISDAVADDPYQIWHTGSIGSGSNYVGFGNAESDKLIDGIHSELDAEKRLPLYKQLEDIIYDECPYIFLYAPRKKVAIHKRFGNVPITANRPGYNPAWFKQIPYGSK